MQDDLVEEIVVLGGRDLSILRPRDAEALIDEERFERDEFLPYWADLWPSAHVLAQVLHRRALRGRRVLELGCGLGLGGLAAALAGGRVTVSDWSAEAVALAVANAQRNGLRVDGLVTDWNAPFASTWPLVIAADVLYEARNAAVLPDVLARLVAPGGEAWIADPGRAFAPAFLRAAADSFELGTMPHAGGDRITVHVLRWPRGNGGEA